ncbi:hypothetical protein, conserved [Trypanosoma cruzi]|uniref:Heat shock protein-like protein n=1 Tax=Trypanosoma cruzi (strain CL Brener) TaxID=353153 RepID=Q4DUR1_TRYCC|nr:hypothetical protein, conserved [Trypanosoma cruzi]EAN96248.1 hypothetical protein, conserved [Trypanosoma cruzi]|eukprot:XP_818099.1 hypothetical protein [Trypanosoma cruzi strain CL Brener]
MSSAGFSHGMQLLLRRMLCIRARTVRCVLNKDGGLLCLSRGCCHTPKNGRVNSSVESCPTVELPDALDMDEAMTLNVYRPYGEKEAPLQEATKQFLYTLITTPDEQEWKDMLAAAIRLDKWREHHLRAVLRSVHQTQYDIAVSQGGREGKIKGGCTPATRLQRALGVMQTSVDEGYHPTPESVHALLVVLLRAILRGHGNDVTGTDLKELKRQSPLTTHEVVWQFLAWMERHNYHVMSAAVLEDLERLIEGFTREGKNEKRTCEVRQNRLEYLRNERDLLLEGSQLLSKRGVNRKELPPVTVPDGDRM